MVKERLKNFYNGKKVLVTGGAGFIGSALVAALVELNADVYVVDDLSKGKLDNLSSCLPAINFFCQKFGDEEFITKLKTYEFAIVFHLAAVSSVPAAEENQELCYQTNVEGFSKLLNTLAAQNSCTVVFSSSSAVYGEVKKASCEKDTPKPISAYATSKLAGESILEKFAREYGHNSYALRYFNVFADDKPIIANSDVFSLFKQAFLEGKIIKIFGTGEQLRDYVPRSKVVLANLIMPLSKISGFTVFNIASGKSISLFTLIEKLQAELSLPKPPLTFMPARQGDVKISKADVSKFNNLLKSLNF